MIKNATTSVVELKENSGTGWVNDSVSFYLETDEPIGIDQIITPPLSNKFMRLKTQMPEFGYFDKGIWLKISVRNQTSKTLPQMLIMHANFMPEMDVYYVVDETKTHILHQNRRSAFRSRSIKYHQLVAPFTISAGDKGDIYIRYKSEGITSLPVSLETPVSFAETTNKRVTIDFIFYGIMAMFILASLLGRLFWRNPTFITYALYAASVLFYIFQRDGYAFQYLWPNAPTWNNFSSLPIGASTVVFAALFTRSYLNSNRLHHNIDKLLIGIVIMQLSVIGSAWIIGGSEAKQLAVMTTTLSILILFGIGVTAYLNYGRRALFFVIGWFGILFASVTMTLVHWSPLDFLRSESLDLMRMAFVFDAFMLGLASVVSVVEIQKDREKLADEQINTLSTNLDLHTRLGRLEQKYNLMQSFAERATQRVENTAHDLRQPLFALRSAISNFSTSGKSENGRKEIEDSLTYIEGLVETELTEAFEQEEVPAPRQADGAEMVKVEKLFSSLSTMFKSEAEKNKIDLKFVNSETSIYAPPFPVLRILANFLSNAIRYAPGERIIVGARRQGNYTSLEVHDTGPGMDTSELERVRQRYKRGKKADEGNAEKGLGLGLSIVDKLAKENQLEWAITSKTAHGTVAKLRVPVAE